MLQPLNKTLFLVLALFFIGTAAFVSLDTFRGYRAEVTILVLPLAMNQAPAEQVVENIAILPTTVSFFDSLLASDERLSEFSDLDEQPTDIRAERWDEMLSVKREAGSGVIIYAIEADTQEEATLFARQMAKVLFQRVGIYYDIRSDVSLRLIEGPIVRTLLVSPATWITLSVGFGIAVALDLMIIGAFFRSMIDTPRRKVTSINEVVSPASSRSIEAVFPSIHPDTFIPKKPTVFFSEEGEARAREEKREQVYQTPSAIVSDAQQELQKRRDMTMDKKAIFPSPVVAPIERKRATEIGTFSSIAVPKSKAPENLPFIDEATFLARFSSPASMTEELAAETDRTESETDSVQPIAIGQESGDEAHSLPEEPTMEDYRRRLNELLKEGK